MKTIICKTYDEMSRVAADIVAKQIQEKPASIIGLPTGSTPIGMYKELVNMYKKGEVDFSNVKTFNLDEYYKIERSNPQSYYYFMNENLYQHVNLAAENINIPDGNTDSVEEECIRYSNLIEQSGGIDLQVLGIGINGHIGFNEPAETLNTKTHMVTLTEDTIEANSRFFNDKDEVPRHALTMGIGDILKAKKIILLINGKGKAKIAKQIFEDKVTTQIPASLLQLHPDVTVILDEEAASEL